MWPGLERPFSTPKLALLVGGVVACAAFGWRPRRQPEPPTPGSRTLHVVLLLWLAPWAISSLLGGYVSIEVLVLGVFGGLWALVLARAVCSTRAIAAAQVLGGTGVAFVTLLQTAGADPFPAAGWAPAIAGASPRLALYGTLGNPNFVAALMAGTAPLAAWLCVSTDGRSRWLATAALASQVAALAATGSRGGALGLVVGAVAWFLFTAGRRRAALALAALAVGGLLVAVSPARPLKETLSGRFYIWRVTWARAWDQPVTGHGPGALQVLYPGWEREFRRAAHRHAVDAVFAGPQQHAHNDYLEALVERGVPGAVSLAVVAGVVFVGAWSAPGRRDAAAGAAGVVALAAVALVDFPLARPAEVALFWTAAAVAIQGRVQEGS